MHTHRLRNQGGDCVILGCMREPELGESQSKWSSLPHKLVLWHPAYPIQNESDQPILLNMGYRGYSDQYRACWFVKT
jgi:hypothetical protein